MGFATAMANIGCSAGRLVSKFNGAANEIYNWHVACQARGGCNSPKPTIASRQLFAATAEPVIRSTIRARTRSFKRAFAPVRGAQTPIRLIRSESGSGEAGPDHPIIPG
jgi:hypothetical protein